MCLISQKDKIKAPSMGCECGRRKKIPCRICRLPHLPICPRDFYRPQNDKHSDLRTSGKPTRSSVFSQNSVTVMAVAADFHRDFLIPERYRLSVRPTTKAVNQPSDELCLFFCVRILYQICRQKSTDFEKKIYISGQYSSVISKIRYLCSHKTVGATIVSSVGKKS